MANDFDILGVLASIGLKVGVGLRCFEGFDYYFCTLFVEIIDDFSVGAYFKE